MNIYKALTQAEEILMFEQLKQSLTDPEQELQAFTLSSIYGSKKWHSLVKDAEKQLRRKENNPDYEIDGDANMHKLILSIESEYQENPEEAEQELQEIQNSLLQANPDIVKQATGWYYNEFSELMDINVPSRTARINYDYDKNVHADLRFIPDKESIPNAFVNEINALLPDGVYADIDIDPYSDNTLNITLKSLHPEKFEKVIDMAGYGVLDTLEKEHKLFFVSPELFTNDPGEYLQDKLKELEQSYRNESRMQINKNLQELAFASQSAQQAGINYTEIQSAIREFYDNKKLNANELLQGTYDARLDNVLDFLEQKQQEWGLPTQEVVVQSKTPSLEDELLDRGKPFIRNDSQLLWENLVHNSVTGPTEGLEIKLALDVLEAQDQNKSFSEIFDAAQHNTGAICNLLEQCVVDGKALASNLRLAERLSSHGYELQEASDHVLVIGKNLHNTSAQGVQHYDMKVEQQDGKYKASIYLDGDAQPTPYETVKNQDFGSQLLEIKDIVSNANADRDIIK